MAASRKASDGLGPTGRPLPEFGLPGPRTTSGPAAMIALCNQKGGVGKTTTTINLGAALAEYGRRVLLVDFDPQGALGAGVGIHPHTLEHTIYDVMITGDATAREVIRPTAVRGMDLMPANIDLSGAELLLVSEVGREQSLMRALRPVRDDYDVDPHRLPALAGTAHGQRADRRAVGDDPAGVRVLLPAGGRAAPGHDPQDPGADSTPTSSSSACCPRCSTGPCTPGTCWGAWSRPSGTRCSTP